MSGNSTAAKTTPPSPPENDGPLEETFRADIAAVQGMDVVPTILDVICRITGMGFAAVARVTEDRWIACAIKNDIGFGLKPGGELKIETTICSEVRAHREPIVINHAAEDPLYNKHHTPVIYGVQSYISMPIFRPSGAIFGTLCAFDPRPAQLQTPTIIGTFKLFAELIGFHLDAADRLAAIQASLQTEREIATLREQFIAVLGHDLRNPLAAIDAGAGLLANTTLNDRAATVVKHIQSCVLRMSGLIDDVLDLARTRLGGGFDLARKKIALAPVLEHVVEELRLSMPERTIETDFALAVPIACDPARIAQLLSNLLANALAYGAADAPVRVRAAMSKGAFELSVANKGQPIPPEAMERLFLPFARGEVIPSREGLGLGLYISSEIARAHGGTLTATSSEDETRFTLSVPQGS